MPSADLEDGIDNDIEAPEPPTLSGPIIGIIYPPPEVRSEFNLKAIFLIVLRWLHECCLHL